MSNHEYNTILSNAFSEAEKEIKKDGGKKYLNKLNASQKEWLVKVVGKSESLKAVVTALTTCFVKKSTLLPGNFSPINIAVL